MIECPVRLRRRQDPARTEALLVFGIDPAVLASACPREQDRLPVVFTIDGGFLVVPSAGASLHAVPGTIRLRRLAGDLFVPVDADVIPALLNEEIIGLTRSQGLILLPGGAAFGFDAASPLPVQSWLVPVRLDRGDWKPFPRPQELSDRLHAIEGPPSPVVLDVLEQGAPPDANPLPGADPRRENAPPVPEDARPPTGSLGQRVVEGARLGLARSLAWLGRNLNAPGLARIGAGMARRALEQVPRLTEKILGAQEAALREVLRQLQSGDVEKALRRAPIAVPDPESGGSIGTGSSLGTRDPRYSLRDLLGSGGGGGSGWLGGGDVWLRLAEEYRRLAQDALRRGDHRRAAYLYGVLLRDPRSAANALMAGGFYRDAAIVFRDRLRDEIAAASAFEQAGDFDEALRLFDKLSEFERAANLLRRIGDEERALDYFLKAADQLAGRHRFLAAGDLVRTKAGRRDLSLRYYRRGWADGAAEVVPCGERLLDEFLVAADWPEMQRLLAEAERRFNPPQTTDAGRFFNYVLNVGKDFVPTEPFEEIKDRTRLFFAEHLRAGARGQGRATDTVSQLFGQGKPWPAPIARDAAFAVRDKPRQPRSPTPGLATMVGGPFRITDGVVRAVVKASTSNDLILATTTSVVCWRADDGLISAVCGTREQNVLGVSTDETGHSVYVLVMTEGHGCLRFYKSELRQDFKLMGQVDLEPPGDNVDAWYLQPNAWDHPSGCSVTVATPEQRLHIIGPSLRQEPLGPFLPTGTATHLLAVTQRDWAWDWDDRFIRLRRRRKHSIEFETACRWTPDWVPGLMGGNSMARAMIDWHSPQERVLEITTVSKAGLLFWSEHDGRDEEYPKSKTLSATHPAGYTASCFIGPGKIAAVTAQNEVHWFRVSTTLQPISPQVKIAVPSRAVALASVGKDLIVVLQDGSVVRVPQS